MQISLEEFIKTGKFGKIELGMTKAEVIAQLGDNYAYGDFDHCEIIHYHWFEFSFWKKTNVLFAIQNDSFCYSGLKSKYPEFTLDLWFMKPNKNITYGALKAFLNEKNIIYHEEINRGGTLIWNFKSGVTLDFVDELLGNNEKIEQQEDYLLGGIRYYK